MIPAIMMRQLARHQNALLDRFLKNVPFTQKYARHPLHARLSDWIPDQPAAKILELGCGPGKYVAMLSTIGHEVVGVDPCTFDTWEAIKKSSSAKLHSGIFAEKLPFPDRHFDHAVCLGALLYFDAPEQALQELRRVLKPGAKVVLRTVNKDNLYTERTGLRLDPASKNLYSMEELKALVKNNGFQVHETFAYGYWPPMLTNFWWYLVCVWIPISMQDWLSNRLPPEKRINNILFLSVDS